MKMRHKKAEGGKVEEDAKANKESKGSAKMQKYTPDDNVEREADDEKEGGEMKRGGRVKKRACGGKVEGDKPKMRMDRPQRKSGGRVGSDMSPLSSASKTSSVVDHKTDD